VTTFIYDSVKMCFPKRLYPSTTPQEIAIQITLRRFDGVYNNTSEANECSRLQSIIVKVFSKQKHYNVPPLVRHIDVTVLSLCF